MQNSSVSLLTAVIVGVILFLLGVAWTRLKSARGNYALAKSSVGPARKAMWSTLGGVVKVGFWALVLVAVLVMWQVRDITAADEKPVVPAKVQPSER
jgi:ABC-type Fe3+ transport system permease subunit